MMPLAPHDVNAATLDTIREEFLDASHLGIRHAAGTPPAGDLCGVDLPADENSKQHLAEIGNRALRVYAERVHAVTDAAIRAGLYVLALVPAAGCPGRARERRTVLGRRW